MGLPPSTCAAAPGCGGYFVAAGDGSIYLCDFYVLDEWRMGNIQEQGLEEMVEGETVARLLCKGAQRPHECARCPWLRLCSGGCRRDWYEAADAPNDSITKTAS